MNKARTCGNIIVEAYSKMLQSVDYIYEYKNSLNTIIKEALLSMEKYLDRNKTLSMALRELLSELDYNTDIKCARLEGEAEGEAKGKAELIQELVLKKFQKGYSIEEIAELLELDKNQVKQILDKTN